MISKVTRYYYNLAELCGTNGPKPTVDPTPNSVPDLLYEILALWAPGSTSAEEKTFFADYFWPEYYEAPVLYIDTECAPWEEPTEPTNEEIEEAVRPLVGRIHAWYVESSVRYLKLISLYTSITNKLMDRIESVTSGEVKAADSDTPQTAMTDMFDTGYASRTHQDESEVTVSSDVATPIERLREVQEKLRNFYADWAAEFNKFILHEAE